MAREKRHTILGGLIIAGLTMAAMVSAAVAAPSRGGSVTWFIATDPGRLDPHMPSTPGAQQAVAGIYSSLLQYDPKRADAIVPDLAQRWDVSPDGSVYTFHLRQGVEWHDGTIFNAADVLSTFARLRSPAYASSPCGSFLAPIIQRVEAPDDHTLRVHLNTPIASFLSVLASGWCPIMAQHILERDAGRAQVQSQIGTGPFILKAYTPGHHLVWDRNPLYYDPSVPYLDSVTQLILPHPARQFNAAQFGQVDLWASQTPMSHRQAMDLKRTRGEDIEIAQQPLNTVWTLQLNTSRAPFNKRDMRRAVHLALDRQALLDAVFEGAGVPCAILDPTVYGDWALLPEAVERTPGCRQPKAEDLAEARRLVAASYPQGVTVDSVVFATGNDLERAQRIGAQLRQIGIRTRLKVYEVATAGEVHRKRQYDMIGTQDTAVPSPDPSAPFSLLFDAKGRDNRDGWRNHDLDRLMHQAAQEQDAAKRRNRYHDLQQYVLAADGPTIVIGWMAGWFFHAQRLQDVHPSRLGYRSPTLTRAWLRPSKAELQGLAAGETPPPETEPTAPQPSHAANASERIALSKELADSPLVPRPDRREPLQPLPASSKMSTSKTQAVATAPSSAIIPRVVSLMQHTFPDPGAFELQVSTGKAPDAPYMEGDQLLLHIRTASDAYLEIDYYQADGQVIHLLPDAHDAYAIKAGESFTLGQERSPHHFTIMPPFGSELITVVASRTPFPKTGATPNVEPASIYLERLTQRLAAYKAQGNVAVALQHIRTQARGSRHGMPQEVASPSVSDPAAKRAARNAVPAGKPQDAALRQAPHPSVAAPAGEAMQEKRVSPSAPMPADECLLRKLQGQPCDPMPPQSANGASEKTGT